MTFEEFWTAYPKRKGSNPKYPASLKFATAVKNGADPAHIVASAARYRDELQKQGKDDSEFVCMATTWLNQRRWMDYAPTDYEAKKFAETQEKCAKLGWFWSDERRTWEKQETLTPNT